MKLESSNGVPRGLHGVRDQQYTSLRLYSFVILYGTLYFPSIVLGSNIFEATRGVRLDRYRGGKACVSEQRVNSALGCGVTVQVVQLSVRCFADGLYVT